MLNNNPQHNIRKYKINAYMSICTIMHLKYMYFLINDKNYWAEFYKHCMAIDRSFPN